LTVPPKCRRPAQDQRRETNLPSQRDAAPRATELLASEAMQRLLDDMSKRYSDRIIIFDSPHCC
jgi:hypothetical protein